MKMILQKLIKIPTRKILKTQKIKLRKKRYYLGSYKTLPEAIKALEEARAMVEEAQPAEQPGLFGEE